MVEQLRGIGMEDDDFTDPACDQLVVYVPGARSGDEGLPDRMESQIRGAGVPEAAAWW